MPNHPASFWTVRRPLQLLCVVAVSCSHGGWNPPVCEMHKYGLFSHSPLSTLLPSLSLLLSCSSLQIQPPTRPRHLSYFAEDHGCQGTGFNRLTMASDASHVMGDGDDGLLHGVDTVCNVCHSTIEMGCR